MHRQVRLQTPSDHCSHSTCVFQNAPHKLSYICSCCTGGCSHQSKASWDSSASRLQLPAKRSLDSDSPRSAPPFAREVPSCKVPRGALTSPGAANPSAATGPSAGRLSILVAPAKGPALKTRPQAPALTEQRSRSSSALDLAQLCEQANAAVRDRAGGPVPRQLAGPLAAPERNLSLAHRQALESAQRRHLNARRLQAAWRAADPGLRSQQPTGPSAGQVSAPGLLSLPRLAVHGSPGQVQT